MAHPAHALEAVDPAAESVARLSGQLRALLAARPGRITLAPAEAEALYDLAYQQAVQGRHAQALESFTLLVACRPADVKYLQGLAAMQRALQRFDEALAVHGLLDLLDPFDPRNALAMAECHLHRQRPHEALALLAQVIEFCDSRAAHRPLRERARVLQARVMNGGSHASKP